jgi:hypothetical protein
MAEPTSYQGGSFFLRWWPGLLLALALVLAVMSDLRAIQWITLLVVVAAIHVRWMPWQFMIREEGLTLTFPFGRRVFLPKSSLAVRMETIGATALLGRHRRIGYLLMDRILYEPGNEILLRTAFTGMGYELRER